MNGVVLALGLLLVFEGLVLALLPRRLEELLDLRARLPVETRRMLGLAAVAAGVAMIWLARAKWGL